MKALRRAILALFAALLFAAALRVRGKGGIPPQGGGWRSCPGQIFADVRAAVIGLGAVGARAARQLISTPAVDEIYVFDVRPGASRRGRHRAR